jgi:hypothetical protein
MNASAACGPFPAFLSACQTAVGAAPNFRLVSCDLRTSIQRAPVFRSLAANIQLSSTASIARFALEERFGVELLDSFGIRRIPFRRQGIDQALDRLPNLVGVPAALATTALALLGTARIHDVLDAHDGEECAGEPL